MKTRINSLTAVFVLALSVGLMTGCSHQGVDRELHSSGTDRSSAISLLSEGHVTLGKDEDGNRTCAYYHEGSNGSMWRTKWC